MEILLQLINSLTRLTIAVVLIIVFCFGGHFSACKVDVPGFKADQVEISIGISKPDKPALTCKPPAGKQKHKARKHP